MDLSAGTNVTVTNVTFKDFYLGIWLSKSINNTIVGHFIRDCGAGISLMHDSSNNVINGNNIAYNLVGIYLYLYYHGGPPSNNIISRSNITNNHAGISFGGVKEAIFNDIICNNVIEGNNYGIYSAQFVLFVIDINNDNFPKRLQDVQTQFLEELWKNLTLPI